MCSTRIKVTLIYDALSNPPPPPLHKEAVCVCREQSKVDKLQMKAPFPCLCPDSDTAPDRRAFVAVKKADKTPLAQR